MKKKFMSFAVVSALAVALSASAKAETYTYTQTDWWNAWTPSFELADGETLTFTGSSTYSGDDLQNWKSINTVLVNTATDGETAPGADTYEGYAEYAVLRPDNWGWGDCYSEDSIVENNWDWDNFAAMVADCTYEFDIARSGRTVDVTVEITGANGSSGFQKYSIDCAGDAPIYVFFTADSGVTYTIDDGNSGDDTTGGDDTAAGDDTTGGDDTAAGNDTTANDTTTGGDAATGGDTANSGDANSDATGGGTANTTDNTTTGASAGLALAGLALAGAAIVVSKKK